MPALTVEQLEAFSSSLQGKQLATVAGRAHFFVDVLSTGIQITPLSSGKLRLVDRKVVGRVLVQFTSTGSFSPADYHAITWDSSYLLALIREYLDRSNPVRSSSVPTNASS